MKIENFDQVAVTPARQALLKIADEGLAAIDTGTVIREVFRRDGDSLAILDASLDLREVDRLVFIAVGKCAADAAVAAAAIVGDRIARGVVLDVKECPPLDKFQTFRGSHPLPSDDNLAATEAIVAALKDLTERDAVVFIISGGGSTLLFLPQNRNDREEVAIFRALTNAGATIEELNTVRKHLSLARGGWLAEYAYPARVISLIFSDVPGDDIAFIASGPTVKDATTVKDAEGILARFDVLRICDIEKCDLVETPKDEKYFKRVTNITAVSNRRALTGMQEAARRLGFSAEVRDARLSGEVTEVARMILDAVHAAPPHTALFWGGETTVAIKGAGRGGRNLQLAATMLEDVRDGETVLSFDSDGRDHGPYAGAVCDVDTRAAIAKAGLDLAGFRKENNTELLFEKAGNYVMTGDTGSNVSDLIIALKW